MVLSNSPISGVKQDYHILIIEDSQRKRSLPLSYATYSAGRDSSNPIRLIDQGVSRLHLMLVRKPAVNNGFCYQVIDGDVSGKKSLNGIQVNGVPCFKKDLRSGDIITLGKASSICYMRQCLTAEEYDWYFKRHDNSHRSIQSAVTDPTATMTTTLL